MNKKITLPKAARMMADASGLTMRQCEDFLKSLAEIVTETLSEGESIKVKGLGTFRLTRVDARRSIDVASGEPTEIAEHSKVVFVPCKEMAAEVNSPFEFFEAIELDDSVNEEDLDAIGSDDTDDIFGGREENPEDANIEEKETQTLTDEVSENRSSESVVTYSEEEYTETTDEQPIPEPASLHVPEAENEPDLQAEGSVGPETAVEQEPDRADESIRESVNLSEAEAVSQATENAEPANIVDDEYVAPVKDKSFRFGRGFIVGFAVCLVAVAIGMGIAFAYMFGKMQSAQRDSETPVVAENVVVVSDEAVRIEEAGAVKDTAVDDDARTSGSAKESGVGESAKVSSGDVPTEASDAPKAEKPVYDTITKTRYLTTMAKEHYGDFNLWPYIYEENKAILGHPDRIRPGTKVVIPPLSKYGVTVTPAAIEKAKRLGTAIYARYE